MNRRLSAKTACAHVESRAAFPHVHRLGDGQDDCRNQKSLDRWDADERIYRYLDTYQRAMKPKKEWLRKPSHHPAIPREKAGHLPYSFLNSSICMAPKAMKLLSGIRR